MKKIILDTNFLLIPAQFGIDIFSELNTLLPNSKIFILDKTIDELKKIIKDKKQKAKNKAAAKLALAILKSKKIKTITTKKGKVDDILTTKTDCIIATQDTDLRKRLNKNKIKTIILKQKKYLKVI